MESPQHERLSCVGRKTGRSVLEFTTEDELRLALASATIHGKKEEDWILPEAEEQTVDNETQRLLTLKSYLLLDAAKEEAFDKLTEEACETFGVPISLISLIDLGRQFLFSNTGNPGNGMFLLVCVCVRGTTCQCVSLTHHSMACFEF
jgi:hypothetical protein